MKSVLIVEDERDLIDMYTHKFQSEGYMVDTAENGAWGLRILEEKKIDLVILDMAMPAMNGIEMLQKIKRSEKIKGKPKIIALSNTALDSEMKEMEEAGADKCFVKIKVTPADVCNEGNNLLN